MEIISHKRLVLADVAVDRVLIHVACKEAFVAEVLFAIAVAVEAVEYLGYLSGYTVGLGRRADEVIRRKRLARLPPADLGRVMPPPGA